MNHHFEPDSAAALARLERIAAAGHDQVTSDFDLNNDAARFADHELREASVLIPLLEVDGRLQVVLTRRRADMRHHPGQIAFPGGKRDEGDNDAVATALREAEEEIGLLPGNARVLGSIGTHRTVSRFNVTPVLANITSEVQLRPQEQEVDEIFFVPFGFLMRPGNERIDGRRWQGETRYYHVIPYGPYYIWGATARMIVALRQLWQDA